MRRGDSTKVDMNQAEPKSLEPSLALYGTAASTYFSDTLLWHFLFPYAVVLKTPFAQMGVMRSAVNLCQNILQIGWGGLSERIGKRIFVFMGYLSSGCLIGAFLLFQDSLQLLSLIILQSIFWSAAIPAWNALLGDYTRREARGRVLGRIGGVSRFTGVGATLIVAIITYIAPGEMSPSSFITPFLLSAGASLLGAFLVIFVKELKVKAGLREKVSVLSPMWDRDFRIFLLANGLQWFSIAFAWPLFPYVTVDIVRATVWQIAVIATLSGLAISLSQPKMGSLADVIGRKHLLIVGRFSFFLFPLLYAFARSWLHLLAINVALSVSMSAAMVTSTAYILDSAPLGQRATYTALYNVVFGLATFLGSLIGGMFTDYLSHSYGMEQALFTGLMVSTILRLIMSAGFLAVKETLPKGEIKT
ncbi:MAG: bicyclomycin/multidrug efflux system [Candidatus Bathyarchaeota archaeon BA1]|nr:MAG: bicyclomycin/multidrug efflux system [Candidatus Bathyarchaeota archaeon BA1]